MVVEFNERSLQYEAIEALRFVASAVRYQSDLVRFAVSAGIPKREIYRITGLARTTIDRMMSESSRHAYPCDYCLQENFQQLRHGQAPRPIADSHGYLIYRIGDRLEIIAQKLCDQHRDEDCKRLSGQASARWTWCPHMENTPSQIVYSLGGLRNDSESFRSFFGRFPQWEQRIAPLLNPSTREARLRCSPSEHGSRQSSAPSSSRLAYPQACAGIPPREGDTPHSGTSRMGRLDGARLPR